MSAANVELPRVVVAGTHSGAGKTTAVMALLAALRARGVAAQPFKAGPDYIDPGYHAAAAGRPSRNLDTWMMGPDAVVECFQRSAAPAGLSVVEGVMGLFDGVGARVEAGSTAHLAKLLRAPVVLVVDGGGMARSAAAAVLGFRQFDPAVRVAGVFLNRLGGEGHYLLLKEAIEGDTGVRVLGYLPRHPELSIPERHLGLMSSAEQQGLGETLRRLAELAARHVDVDALLELGRSAPALQPLPARAFPDRAAPAVRARIGVARDAAFTFYYEDNLDLLVALGAELVPFSPLADSALPEDLDGLLLGGGFPEVFRAELAANDGMLASVRAAIAAGMPVYAECGGLMYLSQGIAGSDGDVARMVGAVPAVARMQDRRAALGYVTATALRGSVVAETGQTLRGHEFHWSVLEGSLPADGFPAYRAETRRGGRASLEGWARGDLLASYLHVHFVAHPEAAGRFVERCARHRAGRLGSGGNQSA